MEEAIPEYEVFNICADRGAKGVSATFTIIYRKKNRKLKFKAKYCLFKPQHSLY